MFRGIGDTWRWSTRHRRPAPHSSWDWNHLQKKQSNVRVIIIFYSKQEIQCYHSVGSQLSSDWFANSFTLVVFDNFFFPRTSRKKSSLTTTKKLFTKQSELNWLPTGWLLREIWLSQIYWHWMPVALINKIPKMPYHYYYHYFVSVNIS